MISCFFFSSRRRHTRYWRDWSSDVCSSDLFPQQPPDAGVPLAQVLDLAGVRQREHRDRVPDGLETLDGLAADALGGGIRGDQLGVLAFERFELGVDGVVLGVGDLWRVLHMVARSEEHTSELQSRQYLVCR